MREILFSVGDPSGDANAAAVAACLGQRRPDLRLTGIGGARMRSAGVDLLEDTASRAVMGFAEIVRHLPRHLALLRTLEARLRNAALLVCVDYGGFNLRLAERAKRARVPVLYFITPQVWASRAGRLKTMARTITKAAVILPFEEPLLRAHGIDATFVGHPLLDRAATLPDRAAARAELGIAGDGPVLAMFPGSRAQEVDRLLGAFTATALALRDRIPDLAVIVSHAPNVAIDPARCPFPLSRAPSTTLFRAATAALCKSGTTTLEAAVTGCPLIVAYRTSPLTYQIARRVVTIPAIGLVNVVAGQVVAREFVQDAVQPVAMADALAPLLDPVSPAHQRAVADLARVRSTLGSPGAAGRVADMISALV